MSQEIIEDLIYQFQTEGQPEHTTVIRAWRAYLESVDQQRIKGTALKLEVIASVCTCFLYRLIYLSAGKTHWHRAFLDCLNKGGEFNSFQNYGLETIRLRSKANGYYQDTDECLDSYINCICVSLINKFNEIFALEEGENVTLYGNIPF